MPGGGELRFTTDVVTLTESEARLDADAEPGSYVRLAMADTGAGIPTSIKDRVFEPFFTTKGDGKGSGMGLAMVYGIVRNHSGFVQLISRDGRGTTFIVYLPVAAEHAEVHTLPCASDSLVAGSGRVLVVDDEEPVRQAASAVLRRLGYVVTVPSGATAVAYCSTQPDDVDVRPRPFAVGIPARQTAHTRDPTRSHPRSSSVGPTRSRCRRRPSRT